MSVRPTGLFWFWYLYNILKRIQTKRNGFWFFFALKWNCNKSSCSGYAQWCWPRNERLMRNVITSGTSQSFMFLFCSLDDLIASPTSFGLYFCSQKLIATTETPVTWTLGIWRFLTWRHKPFRNPDSFFALTY